MLEQRIQQQFFESADLQYECAESLAREVSTAAQALLSTITSGGKVLVHGAGPARNLARHAHALLIGRFERERPPLAAVLLGEGVEPLLAAQQVAALAQAGDSLLLVDDPAARQPGSGELDCMAAAHQREAHVVVLSHGRLAGWSERLLETDVLVRLPNQRAPRVLEAQLLVLHALCDALDTQLLGEQEP